MTSNLKPIFNTVMFFIISLLTLSFSSGKLSDKRLETAEELGQAIVSCLAANDKAKLMELFITENDLVESIDRSNMEEAKKTHFKKGLIAKLQTDRDKTVATIQKGFDDIVKAVNKKPITVTSLKVDVNALKDLPDMEIGDMEVNLTAKRKKITFSVEIMHTVNGWKILEKLRLAQN